MKSIMIELLTCAAKASNDCVSMQQSLTNRLFCQTQSAGRHPARSALLKETEPALLSCPSSLHKISFQILFNKNKIRKTRPLELVHVGIDLFISFWPYIFALVKSSEVENVIVVMSCWEMEMPHK